LAGANDYRVEHSVTPLITQPAVGDNEKRLSVPVPGVERLKVTKREESSKERRE
jgi:hypothetical protein